jgi:diguanylate cyclase (GGDEF)-like protein/PAS domain S-box-containing protein
MPPSPLKLLRKATTPRIEFDRAEVEALIDASADLLAVLDRAGRYIKVAARPQDASAQAEALVGRRLHDVLPGWDADRILTVVHRALDTGEIQRIEYELDTDDTSQWFAATVAPTRYDTVVWIARDISRQRRAQAALRTSEAAYRELLACLPAIVYWVDPDPPFAPTYVSPGVEALGYTLDHWLAQPDTWLTVVHPDDRARVLEEIETAREAASLVEIEYRVVATDGRVCWMHDRSEFVRDPHGRVIGRRGVMLDVTERRELQERLAALSEVDELTGVLNRRGFRRMAEHALKVEHRGRRRTALLFLDLDDLKPINDAHGHAAGDRALQSVAGLLRASVRDGDLVGRFGGDEFVVLGLGLTDAGGGERLANRLRERLDAHNDAAISAGQPYTVSFSIGVAEEEAAADLDALLARADDDLYRRKSTRRSRTPI